MLERKREKKKKMSEKLMLSLRNIYSKKIYFVFLRLSIHQ